MAPQHRQPPNVEKRKNPGQIHPVHAKHRPGSGWTANSWRRRWMDSPGTPPTVSASLNISLFAREPAFPHLPTSNVWSPPGATFRLTSVRNADRRRPPALKGKVGRLQLHLDCPCNETFALGLEPAAHAPSSPEWMDCRSGLQGQSMERIWKLPKHGRQGGPSTP